MIPRLPARTSAATSFLSTRSSGTFESCSTAFVYLPQSVQLSPLQSALMEPSTEKQNIGAEKGSEIAVVLGEQNGSQNQLVFCQYRSDDDDDFGMSQLSSRASDFSQVNGHYGPVLEDINSDYKSRKVHPDGDAVDPKSMSSSQLQNGLDFQNSEEVQQIVKKSVEPDTGDECEAPSSLYVAEDVNTEPIDFENNGVLWLPPEPEDEEDVRETLNFEDDDEGDCSGEWGYFHN